MTRDELIADWETRLSAAETEPVGSSPQRAWLARVRSRLYRFLLSLYGEGKWRGSGHSTTEAPPAASTGIVFDSPDAESLTGKPAKQIGKIRSVLKTVASSQDHRPPAGSLSGAEVVANRWLIVADEEDRWILPRCQIVLRQQGVECRRVCSAGYWALEVPPPDHHRASQLLDERRAELRRPPRCERQEVRLVRQPVSPFRSVLVLFAVPVSFCMMILVLTALAPDGQLTSEALQSSGLAALVTAGICCMAMLGVWVQFRLQQRAESKAGLRQP